MPPLERNEQDRAGDMMVMPEFAPAQAGEKGFRAVGAVAVFIIAVLVVDPLRFKAGVQRVPGRAFVGM
jgi:hypothetical protein